ncbi:MAG TPA: signal peptidase I [Solirubrobacterales bacterium]|jgi:signal peptidase
MRSLRLFVTWTVAAFVLAVLLSAALPMAFGASSMVVKSGSMTPTIRTGDVVVVRSISPAEARVGEIVTFKDPDGGDRLLVHRVRAIVRHGARYYFTTQGDANTTREHWSVAATGTIGTVVYRVPLLGFAASWIGSPPGRIGLIIVPALLLMGSLLTAIWRARPAGVR